MIREPTAGSFLTGFYCSAKVEVQVAHILARGRTKERARRNRPSTRRLPPRQSEAGRDHLATLLAEVNEEVRGLPPAASRPRLPQPRVRLLLTGIPVGRTVAAAVFLAPGVS